MLQLCLPNCSAARPLSLPTPELCQHIQDRPNPGPITLMVTAEDSSPFVQEVHALADHVGPLPDAKAQAFLQAYPMDAIFRCGALGPVSSACLRGACCEADHSLLTLPGPPQGAERAAHHAGHCCHCTGGTGQGPQHRLW